MKKILFLLFGLMAFNVSAQDITKSNISWKINRIDNINAGSSDERGGFILSLGGDRVEWNDSNGALVQALPIREVNGSWINVQNNGIIVYEADSNGKAATVTFTRDGGQIRITIAVLQTDGFPLVHEFTIQNFTTL